MNSYCRSYRLHNSHHTAAKLTRHQKEKYFAYQILATISWIVAFTTVAFRFVHIRTAAEIAYTVCCKGRQSPPSVQEQTFAIDRRVPRYRHARFVPVHNSPQLFQNDTDRHSALPTVPNTFLCHPIQKVCEPLLRKQMGSCGVAGDNGSNVWKDIGTYKVDAELKEPFTKLLPWPRLAF